MDRAQPLLKRRRPHRSRRKHVGAGFEISAILDCARQINVDNPDAFERYTVRERMKRVHAIGFKAMGERVHSGRHRQERRKSDRQFGIFNGDLGQHQRMEDDLLFMGASWVITPARPTSEPVPAVVGTAMIGAIPSVLARDHQSPMSSKSQTGRDCATIRPRNCRRPAPIRRRPQYAVMAARLEGGDTGIQV